jgi:hypothetical protein
MATNIPSDDNFHTNADDMRLETFCIIWLDASGSSEDIRDTEQQLRSMINHLKKFQNIEQCQKYIEQ